MTFRYTETGPVGLVENTRALVVSPVAACTGNATDLVTPYMRTVLGFIGITEVDFIHAEGMGHGSGGASQGDRAGQGAAGNPGLLMRLGASSILKQQRSPRAALFLGSHRALVSLFAQEVAAAAADHQKDRHEGGQQQVVSHCSALVGTWGRKRLITSNVQRVIRLVGRMRRIMGHPWLRVVNKEANRGL